MYVIPPDVQLWKSWQISSFESKYVFRSGSCTYVRYVQSDLCERANDDIGLRLHQMGVPRERPDQSHRLLFHRGQTVHILHKYMTHCEVHMYVWRVTALASEKRWLNICVSTFGMYIARR